MENRIRIGFYYVWDKSWMGGVMYARNLLKALNTLNDKDKPFIDVYCRNMEAFEDLKMHTNYPYLDKVIIKEHSIIRRILRKIIRVKDGFEAGCNYDMFKIKQFDKILFPYGLGSEVNKLVYWRPDFQEKHLPHFFSEEDIVARDRLIRAIAHRGVPIVFSSYDSLMDYKKYYPEYNNKTFVMHFAVNHDDFSMLNINDVKSKFGISSEYLLCANQFWKHKNHIFLFKAYKKAIDKGFKKQLVCTGALSDHRNPDYIEDIKTFIKEKQLEESIILPGLIGSNELHCLMKNACAVIQPSLFEGWNTTVEDCKALSKFVYLSNLSVHREQMKENVCFFDPYNEDDLVEKLLTVNPTEYPIDYSKNIREFADNFLKVIDFVKSGDR